MWEFRVHVHFFQQFLVLFFKILTTIKILFRMCSYSVQLAFIFVSIPLLQNQNKKRKNNLFAMLVLFMVIAILQVKSLGIITSVFFKKKGGGAFATNFSIFSPPNDSKMMLSLMYYFISFRPHS